MVYVILGILPVFSTLPWCGLRISFVHFPHYHPLILQHHQWSRIRTNGGWTWAAKGAEHCWTGMMGNQFDDLKLGFNHHTCLKHGDYMGNHAKRKPPVDVLICFCTLIDDRNYHKFLYSVPCILFVSEKNRSFFPCAVTPVGTSKQSRSATADWENAEREGLRGTWEDIRLLVLYPLVNQHSYGKWLISRWLTY